MDQELSILSCLRSALFLVLCSLFLIRLCKQLLLVFLLGFIGAGFVVGIRLVSEWFPHHELGTAEGIYGGWGNFGSAAAAFTLPTVALWFGGDEGWRYAVAITGVMSLLFAFVFYSNVTDTPKGGTYFKPTHLTAMEVTSISDFYLLLIMKIPMYAALALLAWKLLPSGIDMLSSVMVNAIYMALIVIYFYEVSQVWKVNKAIFTNNVAPHHQYKFKQVAVLNVLYFATFGSELAVVSMLPLFF